MTTEQLAELKRIALERLAEAERAVHSYMNTNMVRLRKDTAPTWPEFAADCRTRHNHRRSDESETIVCQRRSIHRR